MQGTVGIEIMSELPDADMIIMPVGGGGLAAGVGTYIKTLRPQVALIGVEPEGAPSMRDALLAGEQTSPICISNCFIVGSSVIVQRRRIYNGPGWC